jgi:peptide-methionine (S)-S-oxide reductase
MTQTATFGAGCFWGVEHAFRSLPGVVKTAVGYMGGTKEKPSYEAVCTGGTGHAEVVEVEFEPEKTSYEDLLNLFFGSHNPTTVNKQGPDVGTQYRSVIFYYSDEQKQAAEAFKERAQAQFDRPIVTEIVSAQPFWRAEEYHQQFTDKHPEYTCHIPRKLFS